jgi:hypothetical protein
MVTERDYDDVVKELFGSHGDVRGLTINELHTLLVGEGFDCQLT